MNKDSFIRFLKDNHAFDEFKEELAEVEDFTFGELMEEATFCSTFRELLDDMHVFMYRFAVTNIDWKSLSLKLKEEVRHECG